MGVDALRGAIEAAVEGRGSLVFVTGEPGMGKTTAAQGATAVATAAGALVLWASCWQDDAMAHAPWRSLLAQLDDQGAAALAALSGTEQFDPTSASAARTGAYARVVDTFTALARQRPIVLVLDDLHWADEGSVRLLAALRGRLPATPMLVIGTYRDNEVAPDAPVLALAAAADRVALAPLTADAVAGVIADVVGGRPEESVVDDVLRRTAGNPFLVVQVSRLLATGRLGEFPAGAREVLGRRLGALPGNARAALDAAAVLNASFRAAHGARVAALEPAAVLEAFDVAASARIVRPATAPGEWEFVHDLFRQAALEAMPSAQKHALHRAAADVLIDLDAEPATIAHHLLSSATGPDADAASWSMRAAEAALDAFAWEDAALHADRALAVLPSGAEADGLRAEAWLAAGRAQLLAGDRDRAVAAFSTAAALGRSVGSAELVARAALGFAADLAGFEIHLFDQRQIDLLEEAAAALASGGDPALRARVLARLSVAMSFTAPTERRLALAEQSVALARSSNDALALAGALAAHCDAIAGPADTERRLAEASEIIELAGAAGDGGLELLGRRLQFVATLEAGAVENAREVASAFARRAAEIGNPLYAWYVPLWRGMWALAAGDCGLVEEANAEVELIGARANSENAPMLALVLKSELFHQAHRPAELEPLLDRIRELMGDLFDMPQAFGNMGRYYDDMGRTVDARAGLDRVLATGVGSMPLDAEWLPGMAMLIEACVIHDHPALELAVDALSPFADRCAVDGIGAVLHGSCARFLAMGLTAMGRAGEAVPLARQALDVNRRAGALLTAHSERTLANALGEGDECDALHRRADATYAGLGFSHLVRSDAPISAVVDDATLRRDGDVWHVTFAGTTSIVKHVKGMADLAMLLPRPGREVHVTELEALPADVAAAARSAGKDEALDRQAVAAYRARLQDLDDELADAEDANDLVRAERARAERDFLLDELSSSLGLGGRARTTGPDPVERLRKAVTSRLRDAIRRIESANPALARHLTNSVRTGTYCSYHPEQPIVWRCEGESGAR